MHTTVAQTFCTCLSHIQFGLIPSVLWWRQLCGTQDSREAIVYNSMVCSHILLAVLCWTKIYKNTNTFNSKTKTNLSKITPNKQNKKGGFFTFSLETYIGIFLFEVPSIRSTTSPWQTLTKSWLYCFFF